MSADMLRRAATVLRTPRTANVCHCEDDGGWTDHWFDRSICPEPCGSMHDICVECGRVKGGCPADDEARKPGQRDLALADWLDAAARDEDAGVLPGGSGDIYPLAVANSILGGV